MAVSLSKIEAYRLAQIIVDNVDPVLLLAVAIEKPQTPAQIAKAVLPFLNGDTLRDKVAWAVSKVRPAFDSEDRFRLVVSFLLSKLKLKSAAPADLSAKLRAAMVTPLFVYANTVIASRQAATLKAAGFNAIASLVDLQTGDGQRDYIVKGRTATKLTDRCEKNIQAVIDAGLIPVLIIRNDWAVRRNAGSVPSIGGQPDSPADFYSATRLRYEKDFLDSLTPLFDHIHFQLSIEPNAPESADFALQLARHLRARGFAGRLFVNPIGAAVTAHEAIRGDLDMAGVEWARSHHGVSVHADPVWNTDVDTALNGNNVRERVRLMEASGKGWILWTHTLANCPGDFPGEYHDVGIIPPSAPTPPSGLTGQEPGFLWKPVGENSRKLRVLLPKEWTGKVDKGSVEVWLGGERIESLTAIGVANGNREHFAGQKPGGSYNKGVSVRATEGGRTWAWAIPNPAGRGENLKAERVAR